MKRSTGLQRRARLERRTRLRAVSKRRRARDADYPAARAAVWDRAGGQCEAATGTRCLGWVSLEAGHAHHLAGRGGPDPHRLTNLLWCCPPCHAHMHHHPAEAYRNGWMVPRNQGGT